MRNGLLNHKLLIRYGSEALGLTVIPEPGLHLHNKVPRHRVAGGKL